MMYRIEVSNDGDIELSCVQEESPYDSELHFEDKESLVKELKDYGLENEDIEEMIEEAENVFNSRE